MVLSILPVGIFADGDAPSGDAVDGRTVEELKEALSNEIKRAEEVLKSVVVSKDGKDVETDAKWVTSDAKVAFEKAIEKAKAVLAKADATVEEVVSELKSLPINIINFEFELKSGTKEKPAPSNEVVLTIFRNLSETDTEFVVKSYPKGTFLYDVMPYSRNYYRLNGYTYSRGGFLIDRYTKVEDLELKTIYGAWTYFGDDRYNFYRPGSLEYTMDKAKAFKSEYPNLIAGATYASRVEFETAFNVVSKMYDAMWGYYDNYGRVYYRNGNWYTYNEYVDRFGTYDMESYRRLDYDRPYGYYGELYERNGRLFTYREYYEEFGRYPYSSERAYNRYGSWDPYYGWEYDWEGYYGSDYRVNLERLIDAIRAIARQYPHQSIYAEYADLAYPVYYDDSYDYYGNSGKVKELRSLVEKAETLRDKLRGYVNYETIKDLQSYIDDANRALRNRANLTTAFNNLEKAIKRSEFVDDNIYIRRAYMAGDTTGKFGPYDTLTRAQVAQIVANLLKQSGKTTVFNPKQYKDVEAHRWYKEAVDLVSSYGIMTGTPGGLFEPNKVVTKAELIVTAARLKNHQPTAGNVFNLKSHYWAQGYIQTAVKNGWVDPKKGFVPDAPITRGETAHIFNGSLGYGADQDYIIKYGHEMNRFTDVERDVDFYYDIMTATNTISYKRTHTGRLWLSHIRPEGRWTFNQYSQGKTIVPLN